MSEKPKAKAYVYTRVSTAMQVDGFSLDAQRDEIRRFAELKKIDIVGEYCDEGKSGKNTKNRTEFNRMLADIKRKKDDVRYVLVFKLSRFARNAADTLENLRAMQNCGVDLLCTEDGMDSSSTSGKLIISIMSAFAEMELENIHTQTMAGRRQKAKEGKWNGGFAPYGYKLVDGLLTIVEDEAETVKYIFELFTTTPLGANGVAKRLNAEGIAKNERPNGKHTVFTGDFIKKTIDNPVYMGKIAYGRRKTEKVSGEDAEPILSRKRMKATSSFPRVYMMPLSPRKSGKMPMRNESVQVSKRRNWKKSMSTFSLVCSVVLLAENRCTVYRQGKRERMALHTLSLMPISADSPRI